MKHVRELDGLRGWVSILVVVAHLKIEWGFWLLGCMDVFFCMSGFVVAGLLLNNQDKPGFYRTFVLRRIIRLWPSYYAVLIVSVLMWMLYLKVLRSPMEWQPGWGTLRYFLFAQNTQHWFVDNAKIVFDQGEITFLAHCWSVALEEQFYFLAALICWLIVKMRNPQTWMAVLLVTSVIGGISLRTSAEAAHWTLPGRFDGFAAGMLLAVMLHRAGGVVDGKLKRLTWSAILLALLTLVVLHHGDRAWNFIDESRPIFSVGVSAYSMLAFGSVALIYAYKDHGSLAPLRTRPILFLGNMSYSTYLWHYPVIWYSDEMFRYADLSAPAKFLIQFALCFLTAYAAHLLIERPFLTRRPKYVDPAAQHGFVKQ